MLVPLWRACRALLVALALLFLVVTFTPLVRIVTSAVSTDWYDGGGDVLVVLGGSMLVPGTGLNATMGQDTYLRSVYASWTLKQQSFLTVVVTGDNGTAEAMAAYLEQHGVEPRRIAVENRASSTFQNALFTKELLKAKYGAQPLPALVILTSDYHSWRAKKAFQRLGMQVRTIPIPDVQKRAGFPLQRWPAFLFLLTEFAKDGYYLVAGKL